MRERRTRAVLRPIWRTYRWLIILVSLLTVCMWFVLLRGSGDSQDSSAANGVLRKLYAPYDSREIRWLMTNWPGVLFIVDPSFLDCVAKTAEKFGVDFCLGILSQNDVVSLGSYPISDSELKNFTNYAGSARCIVTENLVCGRERRDFALPHCRNGEIDSKVSHLYVGNQGGQLIHIAIFQPLSDGLSMTSQARSTNKQFASCRRHWQNGQGMWNFSALAFGKSNRVYDRIALTSLAINSNIMDIPVLIPTNLEEFRHSYFTSNFIPCNRSSVEAFLKAYPNMTSTDDGLFRARTKKILFRIRKILDEAGVVWWISSGTLLGWFRQCDIIPYSQDIDIGIFIKDFKTNLADLFEDHGFETAYRLGMKNDSLQISFAFDETKVDIYFFYEEFNQVWNGATAYVAGQKFKYTFPRFTLCWTSFLGILVRIPCQPLTYIRANYGDTWFRPVEKWDWRISPPNAQLNGFWTENQKTEAIYLNPKFYGGNGDVRSVNATI
ncbi:ribitol-5-phosphate transferase FKTN-like [Paramacrobiotus metropolitanus]|uniref:ribitol-5-phosphate transferase FKTN-like n=1 Tax=Paramacrobiotus metropolitanus TaxID=2943436 RepID=UPI002445A564|nr:ribitol-5-phosphate transferase FKTN-like [Paramacrobiotus metropolitanus]